MPTRTTRSRQLTPILIVIGLVAVVAGITTNLAARIGNGEKEPVVLGEGDSRVLVGRDGQSKVRRCKVPQLLAARRCNDTKVLVIDAAKMPHVAHNIAQAWAEGKLAVLHRDRPANRLPHHNAACRSGFVAKYPDGSCDEYEFASAVEGGAGARTEEVPRTEQDCQGGTVHGAYYRIPGIAVGEAFVVVSRNPSLIATRAYEGVPTAKDPICEFLWSVTPGLTTPPATSSGACRWSRARTRRQ